MRTIILCFLIYPLASFGAPFDLLIPQKNIANSATITRTIPVPELGVNSVLGTFYGDNLPVLWKLGTSMGVINNELVCGPDWMAVTGKPHFSAVSVSGDYNDLINTPPSSVQVNADWSASSGIAQILNKPALASVATSGAYSDLSGTPSIPAAQVQSDWNAVSAPAAILNKPSLFSGAYSALTGIPSTFAPSAHTHPISQVTGLQTALDGKYAIPTGNTTQYLRGDGSIATFPTPSSGTVTSITAGAGLSGGNITSSGTISMPNVGNPGTYSGVSTDSQGRVTGGSTRVQSAATRALNTVFQVSATRDALVNYSVQCTITASIAGGQSCDVVLEIATDAAFTANVQTVGIIGTGQTYTLAIAIQGVQPQTAQVTGYVPAGYYARLRTVNVSGSPAYAYRAGQEILQ